MYQALLPIYWPCILFLVVLMFHEEFFFISTTVRTLRVSIFVIAFHAYQFIFIQKRSIFPFFPLSFPPPPLSLAFLLYFAVIPQHGMYNRHSKYYMLPFIYQSKKMTANKRLFFFTKSKKWFFFLLFPFCSSCFCWIKKVKAATAILHIKRESKECYELAE